MQRITSILIFLVCLGLFPATTATAFFFGDDTLVTIDGNKYSMDDFKHWWKFWKEEDEPLPKTPDHYIDWLLLSREGERMELTSDPGFKRQTRIFLQSRTLLMLKYDAVNSRIKVTDDDIKTRYEEKFLPRWLVQRLRFKDADAAEAAWKEFTAGTVTVEDLVERDPEQGGPESTYENWLRPNEIDPGWVAIFQSLEVGQAVDPSKHNKGPTLYFLKEQKGGDEEDLAKLREGIEKDLWKEKENELTLKLLAELREKYQVKVDEERLAALDISANDDTFTDDPVITTTRQNISEKEFMVVIRKLMSNRTQFAHAAGDEEAARKLKTDTANNIIAQSVTNWESLDRHYEEKEPFKWEYEFNFRHRLVLAVEQSLFGSETKVTDDEIKQHYEENVSRYSQPGVVKLYIIDETQGPIDQIWADVAVGKNFERVAKELFGKGLVSQEIPANHLDPEVKPVVDKLVDGETSQIFRAQGIRVLVHLIERTPEAPLPLERVKETIRNKLSKEKLNQLRQAYIDKLKAGSEIEVRMQNWEKIQKELGGA